MSEWRIVPANEIYGQGVNEDGMEWAIFGAPLTAADLERLIGNPLDDDTKEPDS